MDALKGAKVVALDKALLFISSVIGFLAALVIAFLGRTYLALMLSITPLLLVSTVLPVYVGYFRGAVELDSLRERVRGWVSLLLGTGLYVTRIVHIGMIVTGVDFWLRSLIFKAESASAQ